MIDQLGYVELRIPTFMMKTVETKRTLTRCEKVRMLHASNRQ